VFNDHHRRNTDGDTQHQPKNINGRKEFMSGDVSE